MNVQLFGNIDNKTYQAPRINLMQKVQEKGATPLTFKETIKGLNDANVSVSISDEGLKALHGSKLQGAIDPMETAKQIEYMSNHQPVESFSNRFAQMLPSNYEMNDQGEAVFVSHTLQEKEDALISGFKQLYNEISIGHSLGTRIRYIEDETAEDGFRKLTKDEELEILKQEFDDFVDSRFGAEAQAQNAKAAKAMKEIEQLKESLEADSGMRATAASAAALSAAANGLGGTSEADAESQTEEGIPTEDGVKHEKNWTKNLKTDDQTVLRTAKEAQEMENKALSRFEEVQLTGTTTVGVSQTDTGTECASVEEDENKEKVWTITAFGEDGIVSTRCQNGKIIDSWEIKYTNPNDAKKVQDFIGRFEKDANLIFSGSKDFWEEFLSSDMDADSIFTAHAEAFDKAAPDAPPIVKNAWMNAAKETGYLV